MGKSAPSAPAAPDPAATAAAQSGVNKETAITQAQLNRVNQVTPYGNLTYSQTPGQITNILGPGGDTQYVVGGTTYGTMQQAQEAAAKLPDYTATTSLSPDQSALLGLQTQGQLNLGNLGISQLGRISTAVQQPFSYSGMPSSVTSIDPSGNLTYGVNGGEYGITPQDARNGQLGIVNGFNINGFNGQQTPLATSIANAGNIQQSVQSPQQAVQSQLDFSGVPGLMSTGDMNQALQTALNARMGLLTPQEDIDRQRLETQLANQGIAVGSQAYNNAFTPFNNQIAAERNAATTAAYGDLNTLFGISLGSRQQGVNELTAQGNFANAAQQQAYNQALGLGQFANAAQQQQYQQNATDAAFQNAVQQQGFGEKMQLADLANQAQNQYFNQQLSNANLNNSAIAQQLNQLQAQGAFQNAARANAIQEAAYLRAQPLNEFNSFMSGSQVQMPTFQTTPMTQVASTDITGPTYAGYQGAMNSYNQQLGQQNATAGGLFGLGGSALGGWALNGFTMPAWLSDRRLKRNVKLCGRRADGLGVYDFEYLWGQKSRGFMADEVEKLYPEAVIKDASGFARVNYADRRLQYV